MTSELIEIFRARVAREKKEGQALLAHDTMQALAKWLAAPDTLLSVGELATFVDVGAILYQQSLKEKALQAVDSAAAEGQSAESPQAAAFVHSSVGEMVGGDCCLGF